MSQSQSINVSVYLVSMQNRRVFFSSREKGRCEGFARGEGLNASALEP